MMYIISYYSTIEKSTIENSTMRFLTYPMNVKELSNQFNIIPQMNILHIISNDRIIKHEHSCTHSNKSSNRNI